MTKYSKIVLFTLCLFYFFQSFCYSKEQNDSLKIKNKKFSFAIYAGVIHSFRNDVSRTRNLNLSNTPDEDYHLVVFPASSEKGVTTTNAGIYFEFQQRRNIFLNVGVCYTQIFYETRDNTNFNLTFKGNASPYPHYVTTSSLQIKDHYYFISFPICLYYRLNCKKFSYSFGGGASLGVYRSVIIESPGVQYGAKETLYSGPDPIGIMGTLFARIGIFHSLGKNMLLGFEPECKYYSHNDRFFTLGGNLVMKF